MPCVRCALWILGEYCSDSFSIESGLDTIKTAIGPLPLHNASADDEEKEDDDAPQVVTKNVVLADGTYATQSSAAAKAKPSTEQESNLRALLLAGDFFLGSVICTTLTKLILKEENTETDPAVRRQTPPHSPTLPLILLALLQ